MQNNDILSYLGNMKGRVLKIFKDGPESKTGKLLNVHKNYLSIQTEENQVVYYQLIHIKSIIENSKLSMLWNEQEDAKEVMAKTFNQVLNQLLFENIQINGGGPVHRTGKLVDIKTDYLVLQTNQVEVIYYQLEHIKSVSVVNKDTTDDLVDEEADDIDEDVEVNADVTLNIIVTNNFLDLLKKMKHQWIVINGKGPEHIQGVLVDIANDHITLVHHDEVSRISTYHINNISLGKKEDKKENKKEDKKEDKEDDDKKNEHKKEEKKDDDKKQGHKKEEKKDDDKKYYHKKGH